MLMGFATGSTHPARCRHSGPAPYGASTMRDCASENDGWLFRRDFPKPPVGQISDFLSSPFRKKIPVFG
jgi:hypothetical protein